MMALIGIFRLIPSWAYRWLAAAAIIVSYGLWALDVGESRVQKHWDASKAAIATAEAKAVAARVADNSKLAIKQAADSAAIQKGHDDEIFTLHARIAAAPRLRSGTAVCTGFTGPAGSSSAGGSAGEDPGGRVVREDVDRDIRALMAAVEDALATGRACQAFVQANGMSQ